MQLEYESPFISIVYHSDMAIVEGIWKESTSGLMADDFKIDMRAWLKIVQAHQPVNVMVDALNYFYTISPDLQTWVNENILAHYYTAGVKKLAFLVPTDIFAQVSIKQTIEEQEQTFATQYFDDKAKALAWLSKS